jgi:hypothetical protein
MTDIQCSCEPRVICQECFRAAQEKRRALLAADALTESSGVRLLEPRRTLTGRDVEHRQRMMTHLQSAILAR